jgi:hypothetical protein
MTRTCNSASRTPLRFGSLIKWDYVRSFAMLGRLLLVVPVLAGLSQPAFACGEASTELAVSIRDVAYYAVALVLGASGVVLATRKHQTKFPAGTPSQGPDQGVDDDHS